MAKYKPDLSSDRAWAGETDWRPPSQATFLSGRSDASYWMLVDQLMHLGWYRLGQRAGNGREWGFRRGYTLPDYSGDLATVVTQERWIAAFHEHTAMRRLLREVQGRSRARGTHVPEPATAMKP